MTLTMLNNRYQVLSVLGNGGFGETFLAEDTQMPSSRRCVIKQLKPVANNPQVYQLVQERFQQEAAILEELGDRSNQIPRLYAYFSDSGLFYLVQEYIEGQTLAQKLQQQGLQTESTVKEILINILPVLEYVHNKGVHRDIKPDNIILRHSDGKPVLIDFGAVKLTMGTEMTPSGHSTRSIVIGTPGFMPMEQAAGRPVFSSDLYSLGLTAIYLLSGKLPQEIATDPATGDILWRNHVWNISPDFAAVLDKAIQQSPRDRYRNAREMLVALQTPPTPFAPTLPTPQPTPTLVSSPPAGGGYVQPPTVASPPFSQPPYQQTVPSNNPTLSGNGLGTWQQAVIIGGVIGSFIVGGFWVMGLVHQVNQPKDTKDTVVVSKTTSPTPTPIISPTVTSEPEPPTNTPTPVPPPIQPRVTIQPQTTAAITQDAAVEVITKWLAAKREIFGPSLRSELADEFITGIVYTKFIKKTADPEACLASGQSEDTCLSSVDWLRRNGAYWIYGVQKIESVKNFVASGNNATIEVLVTEKRTLYNNKGNVDQTQSGIFTSTTSYDLQYQNGKTKISNYK